ncbi:hypothetical protein AB0C21_21635 [Spirillospora sp. NPDC049024]
MSKSTRLPVFGRGSSGRSGRRGGTVTLIEDRVTRSYTRTAKTALYVVTAVVGLLAAVVAASYLHPIVALVAGLAIGLAVALPTAGIIAAWPVIRVVWWWLPEITVSGLIVAGFVIVSDHTGLVGRVVIVGLVAGVPAAISPVRRRIVSYAWCLISRHRLRACFNEFIISNRSGSLPLILWAMPTPVGERIWIWLRPGLAVSDLENRLDKIAVACWAANVTVERASSRNAAFLRIDIKRRNALTGTVNSPLVDMVDPNTPATVKTTTTAPVPTALDLPDIPAPSPVPDTIPRIDKRTERADKKPASAPSPAPASGAAPAPKTAKSVTPDDVLDWV